MKKLFMPDLWVSSVYDLTVELLKSRNIRGLILDIDNTLATYDEPEPSYKLKKWLKNLQDNGFQISFVSNNKKVRVDSFNQSLSFDAYARAMKPFPRNIKKALKAQGLLPNETAMVGDQIFTDVMGGNFAGVQTILVDYISAKESIGFKVKRWMERPILRRCEKMDRA